MNYLLNLLGGNKLWQKLDGAKTYIGGGILLLSSSAGLLAEVLKLVNDKNPLEAFAFVKGLPQDQFILSFAAGLVAVGLRHAVAKQEDALPAPAPTSAPVPELPAEPK